MALTPNKFIIPLGAPSLGKQATQSVTHGELLGILGNGVVTYPVAAGAEDSVMKDDGSGNLSQKTPDRNNSLQYKVDTSGTGTPPPAGTIRFNNGIHESATEIFISDNEHFGANTGAWWLAALKTGALINIQSIEAIEEHIMFEVTGEGAGGSWTSATVREQTGSLSSFGNGTKVTVTLIPGQQRNNNQSLTVTETLSFEEEMHSLYGCNDSAGDAKYTMDSGNDVVDRLLTFKKENKSNNIITIAPPGGDTLDGEVEQELTAQFDSMTVYFKTGSLWFILSRYLSPISVRADRDGQGLQAIPTGGTPTIVEFSEEERDIGGYYDNTTFTFTPPKGRYNIKATVLLLQVDTAEIAILHIFLGGTALVTDQSIATAVNQNRMIRVSGEVELDGAQNVTIRVEHDHGSDLDIAQNPDRTWLRIFRTG